MDLVKDFLNIYLLFPAELDFPFRFPPPLFFALDRSFRDPTFPRFIFETRSTRTGGRLSFFIA